jgi:hypothetical protein
MKIEMQKCYQAVRKLSREKIFCNFHQKRKKDSFGLIDNKRRADFYEKVFAGETMTISFC